VTPALARQAELESLLSDARLLLEAGRAREALLKVGHAVSLDALSEEARSLERLARAELPRTGEPASPAAGPGGVAGVDIGATIENVVVEPEPTPPPAGARQAVRVAVPDASSRPADAQPARKPPQAPAPVEPSPAAPAATELPPVARPHRARPSWKMVAAGAVVAVAVGIIALVQSRTGQESPPPGTLVINAVPWGRVREVVDSSGRQVATRAGAFTPVSLMLPPGRYTVSVVNPDSAREARFDAEVVAGQVVRRQVELGTLSEDDLLRGLGLDR
jgi:hypothetical protein